MTIATGSQAAYARRHGVSKQTATDWKQRGLLVFTRDGKVDFAASDRMLSDHGIRQPPDGKVDERRPQSRLPAMKRKPAPPGFAILDSIGDPFDRGVAAMGLSLLYESGLVAANSAVDCGADMRTAFALNRAVRLSTAVFVQKLAEQFGISALSRDEAEFIDPDCFHDPDWELLAEAASESVDLAAWEAAWADIATEVFNE